MTASRDSRPTPRSRTVFGTPVPELDRADVELRRVLLSHLALDIHPNHLARVVVRLCAAIAPMLAPPTVTVGVRADLSDRELQVLVGMASGRSNAQLGRELHLSEDTVKTYARRLYANLGVRDRAHAVARGFQEGILLVGDRREQDVIDDIRRTDLGVPAQGGVTCIVQPTSRGSGQTRRYASNSNDSGGQT